MNLEEIKNICDQYKDCAPEYYTVPIPEKKANNARASLNIPHGDQIFALVDFTVFGSAKDAMVVTESGLYWKGIADPAVSLSWNDLSRCTPSEKLGIMFKSISFSNGLKMDLSGAGTLQKNDNPVVLQLLNDLKTLSEGKSPVPTAQHNDDSEEIVIAEISHDGLIECEFCQGKIKPEVTYCKHCGIKLRG